MPNSNLPARSGVWVEGKPSVPGFYTRPSGRASLRLASILARGSDYDLHGSRARGVH